MTEVKGLRRLLQISQYQLSIKSGVSRNKISLHESGYVKLCQGDMQKVMRALKQITKEQKGAQNAEENQQ